MYEWLRSQPLWQQIMLALLLLSLILFSFGLILMGVEKMVQRFFRRKRRRVNVDIIQPVHAGMPITRNEEINLILQRVRDAENNPRTGLYSLIVASMSFLTVSGIFFVLRQSYHIYTSSSSTLGVLLALIGAVLIARHLIVSIQSLGTDEVGILTVLNGMFVRRLGPNSLVYAPWPLCTVFSASTQEKEFDLPASDSETFFGDLKDVGGELPPKYTALAERVNLSKGVVPKGQEYLSIKGSKKNRDGSISHDVEIGKVYPDDPYLAPQAVTTRYSIGVVVDDYLAMFIAKGPYIDNVVESISDHAMPRFNEVLARMCPAEVRVRTSESSTEVLESLVDFTRNWGVRVTFARIKAPIFSHPFNTSLTNAASAVPEKTAAIVKSEGQRQARINVGQGEASYIADVAKASQADGGLAYVTGQLAGAVTAARAVVLSGDQGLSGMAAMVKTTLDGISPKTPESKIVLTDGDNPSPAPSPTPTPKPNHSPANKPRGGDGRKRRK